MLTCCLCFCCSSCAVHLMALGAALALAGLLQLSLCRDGLTVDADAMAAMIAEYEHTLLHHPKREDQ